MTCFTQTTSVVYHILEERRGQGLWNCLARSSPENPGGRLRPAACFMRDKALHKNRIITWFNYLQKNKY